jgi:ribosomal protein S18 acetylase RimI-like enzyme
MRLARPSDIDTIVAFTLEEAYEAEGTRNSPEGVRRGVEGGFRAPPASTYWVAENQDAKVVAHVSVVTEWSDFHGGYYWWIQSLFIVPAHRGGGLVGIILDHLAASARDAGALDLRLYAHVSNQRALHAYRRHGFTEAPYVIMRKPLR